MKLQWMMVAVVIAAILTWGAPSLVSQAMDRWKLAQDMARDNARLAATFAARGTG
jgi:hypothetical protein